MKNKVLFFSLLAGFAASLVFVQAENLVPNSGFDQPNNPFAGWNVDYSWTKRKVDLTNQYRLKVLPTHAGKQNVVEFPEKGGAGSRIESVIIPFDPNAIYEATLDVKGNFRIYFAGYKWKPGIRPHDNPKLGELRTIYKSKPALPNEKSWKSISLKVPTKKPSSDLQKQHLEKIRFITLYVWSEHGGFVDNISIRKK